MEKGKAPATTTTTTVATSFQNLAFNSSVSLHNSQALPRKRTKPPSLVNLCVTIIGKHLEDLIPDLGEIAIGFPAHIKMAIAAIARRRKLLDDDVLISLVDCTWEFLDVSHSDVSDIGLAKVAETCKHLRALDISQCSRITPNGLSQLVEHCHSLEILRCGGCARSDYTARRCLSLFKPELNNVEGDSWEELDTTEITHGGQSLRWLVWPNINPDCLENFSSECPRVKVNPQPSPFGLTGVRVPREAFPDIVLDGQVVEDIDPSTWAFSRPTRILASISNTSELSMAEKFRLAFVERDTRLAPKRAKNARQHQRRAEREWMLMSEEAKAIALASRATQSLRRRNL